MKRLLLALILLATPALAQTGDCAAETGTSTTWEVQGISGTTAQIRFVFYAAGLTGQTEVTLFVGFGPDVVVAANGACEGADLGRTADELDNARQRIEQGQAAETVLPAYPEPCDRVVPAPNGIGGGPVVYCRMAEFHAREFRELWDSSAMDVVQRLYPIFEWMERTGPAGPGFNAGDRQEWANATQATWNALDVEQGMNTVGSLVTGTNTWENNFRGPWVDQ